jgi:hypothetical protein
MIARTLLAITAVALFADAAQVKEVEAWRAKHEADYRRDWVTVSGLYFLEQGPNRAGADPANDIVLPRAGAPSIGTFLVDGARVRFEPHDGVKVTLADGTAIVKPTDLKSDLGAPATPETS